MKLKEKSIRKFFAIIIYSLKQLLQVDCYYLLLLLLSSVLQGIIPFFKIYLVSFVINAILDDHSIEKAILDIILFSCLTVVFKAAETVVLWYRSNHYVLLGHRFDVMNAVKTVNLDYERLQDKDTLNLSVRAAKGCSAVARIGESVSGILANIVQLAGSITIMVQFCGVFSILIVGTSYLCYKYGKYISKKVYDYEKGGAVAERKIDYFLNHMLDAVSGKELRLFHALDLFIKKYSASEEEKYNLDKKIEYAYLSGNILNIAVMAVQMICMYGLANDKYLKNEILLGDISLCIGTVSLFSSSFIGMFQAINSVFLLSQKMDDFKKYQNLDVVDCHNNVMPFDKNEYIIEFKNVSYKYPASEQYALKHVNFKIKKGEKIAIIGENGTGKSTFVKLLLRLYKPTEGVILFNNRNYLEYDIKQYYDLFSTVFQDFNLMAYTIRENIVCGDDVSQKARTRMEEAVVKWGMADKISRLKDGCETYVTQKYNDNGVDFSGGERQKLAISRAFYRNKDFIILDEPTSAIDPIAEEQLYSQMLELMSDKTVILVSHRLSSTRLCEKIAFFSGKTIAEIGTHNELMHIKGEYYKMFLSQAQWYV